MKTKWTIILLLTIAGLSTLFSQPRDADPVRQLERLGTRIEQAAALLRLLPDVSDAPVGAEVKSALEAARNKYLEGRAAANNGNIVRLRILNAEIAVLLRRVETLVKSHPIFQFRFQEELENRLQIAEALLTDGNNREIIYLLERARYYRQRAYDYQRQSRPFAALENFRLALHFAEQVIRLTTRSDRQSPDELNSILGETRAVFEKAQQLAEENSDDKSRQLLTKAANEIRHVEQMIEQQDFQRARQVLNTINKALYRIIDMAVKLPENDKERLQNDIDSAVLALDAVRQKLQDQPSAAAMQVAERADNLLDEASRHLSRSEMIRARRKSQLASRMIANVYRIMNREQQPSETDIRIRLESAKQSVSGLENVDTGWPGFVDFRGLLSRNLDNAQQALNAGKIRETILYLKVVNGLIFRLNRTLVEEGTSTVDRASAEQDLQQLRSLMAKLQSGQLSENDEFGIRFSNAQSLLKIAEQSCQKGQFHFCRMLAATATTIINQTQ